MSEHEKHTEFLKRCIHYDESARRQQLVEEIHQIQRDSRCVRRAVWLTAISTALFVAGLVYPAILVDNFPYETFSTVPPPIQFPAIEHPKGQKSQEAERKLKPVVTDLRQRVQNMFPRIARFKLAAAAVGSLGATDEEKKEQREKAPTVEVKESRGAGPILNWTGTLLAGIGETLVLVYLLLASGDLFLQKLVRVMPTLSNKKRAVEVSHEIQQNISNYLFSVSLINIGLGIAVSAGLYFMGVPKAAMWGMLAAVLNFVPYFGPVTGVILLAAVGLLTFDTLWEGLLPSAWYLLLHLLEANLIAPILLGRRFTLNPVVIFVSLIFWMWLWGLPGALLSVPILVSIKVVCDRVSALSPVSELLSR